MSIPPVVHLEGFPACVHLSIEFNPHALIYQSLTDWIENMTDTRDGFFYDWVSDEERDRAIATNSIWVMQWYPDTPVGFCTRAASSFEALIKDVVR